MTTTPTRARLALAVLTLPALLVALDLSVLLVALPQLSEQLGADAAQQLWITDVYGFLVAGFLVTMGTLGDRIGRRRLLLVGATAFGVASLAAAFAPTPELLLAARAALGIAGATLMPSALALVTELFPDPRAQGSAVAVVFSAIMAGGALGPAVGGLLLAHFWWGSVFLPGVAVMVLLLAVGPRLLPAGRGRGDTEGARLDPLSVGLSLLALLPVVYGVKELARGIVDGPTVAALVVGIVAGVAFVVRQRRLPRPLLDLALFTRPALRGALLTMLLGGLVMGGMFLVVTQYLQLVAGLSPLAAGLATVPGTVAMLLGVLAGPKLATRVRPAAVMAGGLALAAVGLGAVALAAGHGTAWLVVAFTVALAGMGLPGGLGVGLVIGSAPPEQAGFRLGALGDRAGARDGGRPRGRRQPGRRRVPAARSDRRSRAGPGQPRRRPHPRRPGGARRGPRGVHRGARRRRRGVRAAPGRRGRARRRLAAPRPGGGCRARARARSGLIRA